LKGKSAMLVCASIDETRRNLVMEWAGVSVVRSCTLPGVQWMMLRDYKVVLSALVEIVAQCNLP